MEKFDKYKTLIEQHNHKLSGLGCIAYEYCKHTQTLNIYINYDGHSNDNVPVKILTGKVAIQTYLNMIEKVNNLTEDQIIAIGCEVSKKTFSQLKKRTREPEIVFARNLVFWAVNKYLKYSFSTAGAIFDLDHATAIRACRIIETYEDKHLSSFQVEMRNKFKEKLQIIINE